MAVCSPRTPVLVGVAQYVDRTRAPNDALTPRQMLETVAQAAAADALPSHSEAIWQNTNAIAVIRTFADSAKIFKPEFWDYSNLPATLANDVRANPQRLIYPSAGGETPQALVNMFAQSIHDGEMDCGLIAGAEAIRTQTRAQKMGLKLPWSDHPAAHDPEKFGDERRGVSAHEIAHGIALPAHVYPLFENALAHHYGRSPSRHLDAIGELMARFTQTAAQNPYAALPVPRTPEELITPTDDNRLIAYPYTKYLNANMFVDQAAAFIIMSTDLADRLGVEVSKRIYLHGSADTVEKYLVSDRVNYWSAPAIRIGAAHAMRQANVTLDDLEFFDLYSCFPVAVEVAADAVSLSHDDPRGLTITGGLPYFGGPGNNYVTHSIAEIAKRLRYRPGARGLITGNGMYLTKHSFGVYGSNPPLHDFRRSDSSSYQAEIDALESPRFTEHPSGFGRVETFTVVHERGRPQFGIIVGRLEENGHRHLAICVESQHVASMIDLQSSGDKATSAIGRRYKVETGTGSNQALFVS
jgi:acetyl-CoA C-acetyltransferase